MLPSTGKPSVAGGVLLVGTRRLELSKDNFVLRCQTSQGRYVISISEVRSAVMALHVPVGTDGVCCVHEEIHGGAAPACTHTCR